MCLNIWLGFKEVVRKSADPLHSIVKLCSYAIKNSKNREGKGKINQLTITIEYQNHALSKRKVLGLQLIVSP